MRLPHLAVVAVVVAGTLAGVLPLAGVMLRAALVVLALVLLRAALTVALPCPLVTTLTGGTGTMTISPLGAAVVSLVRGGVSGVFARSPSGRLRRGCRRRGC